MSEKKQHIGIIGGSGVYKMDGVKIIKEHKVETLYGQPSSEVMEGEIDGVPFYFIPRHGKDHTILPNEVNYRANIFALKELGVKYIISISAVGSLKEEYPPETFILPDQFIDWTKGEEREVSLVMELWPTFLRPIQLTLNSKSF
jgi:5'-methylthioadenosine phosphorylase